MSSIPTIFNRPVIPHTVIGQPGFGPGRHGLKVSVVLLNRGARVFREETLRDLSAQGWSEIISMEEPSNTADFEDLAQKYKNLKFLLLSRTATPGEQINLGIQEAKGDGVLVLWNDMVVPEVNFYPKSLKNWAEPEVLCIAPEIKSRDGVEIPTVSVPGLQRRRIRILCLPPEADSAASLAPFDYVGLYNRMKFLSSGGYDPLIANPYWQRMDFGMRSFLWGEKILVNRGMKVNYLRDIPVQETSFDFSYRAFSLKNLLLSYEGQGAVLRNSRFWTFLWASGLNPVKAWKLFESTRIWVETHRYRFRTDARTLVETWGSLP